MNINGKNLQSIIKSAYVDKVDNTKKSTKDKAGSKVAGAADEVRLSQFSRDIQKIQEGLDAIKDIDQKRVEELKARIAADDYDVSGRDIAEKMIERILDESA